jgi:hypothetical protein
VRLSPVSASSTHWQAWANMPERWTSHGRVSTLRERSGASSGYARCTWSWARSCATSGRAVMPANMLRRRLPSHARLARCTGHGFRCRFDRAHNARRRQRRTRQPEHLTREDARSRTRRRTGGQVAKQGRRAGGRSCALMVRHHPSAPSETRFVPGQYRTASIASDVGAAPHPTPGLVTQH